MKTLRPVVKTLTDKGALELQRCNSVASDADLDNNTQSDSDGNVSSSENKHQDAATVKKAKILEECQELLDEMMAENNPDAATDDDSLKREVDLYFSMKVRKVYVGNALSFWKKYHKTLPILARIAEIYFGMSSSSVAVESMFSTAALICNSKRSSLTYENFEYILFVHDNFDKL